MNKIKIKVVSLITAINLMLFKARVYAVSLNDIDPKEPTGNEITGVGEKVIGIVTMLGSILAVLVLVILGIKYMMGSTDEKAEYKKRNEDAPIEKKIFNIKVLKKELNAVLDTLDHKDLNELPAFKGESPSSEMISAYIYSKLKERIVQLSKVTVWETQTSCCSYFEAD